MHHKSICVRWAPASPAHNHPFRLASPMPFWQSFSKALNCDFWTISTACFLAKSPYRFVCLAPIEFAGRCPFPCHDGGRIWINSAKTQLIQSNFKKILDEFYFDRLLTWLREEILLNSKIDSFLSQSLFLSFWAMDSDLVAFVGVKFLNQARI